MTRQVAQTPFGNIDDSSRLIRRIIDAGFKARANFSQRISRLYNLVGPPESPGIQPQGYFRMPVHDAVHRDQLCVCTAQKSQINSNHEVANFSHIVLWILAPLLGFQLTLKKAHGVLIPFLVLLFTHPPTHPPEFGLYH